MKKAFTLIELLVVIAIIAILAAILFPVFAQAKLAAKKTAGLAQAKQIGTGLQLYVNDYDDTIPAYRFTSNSPVTVTNPTYIKLLAAGDPNASKIESASQDCVFINQLLDPYIKSDAIWLVSTNPGAWVNVQLTGTADPGFRSYGGQNSYGVNNYVFKASSTTAPASMYTMTSIAEPSNTLGLVDATYYNVLPAEPGGVMCKLGGYAPTSASYLDYWKQLGNSTLNFSALGSNNPDDPSNVTVFNNISARYGGTLNVVKMDSSAKSMNGKQLVYDLISKGSASIWNPTKGACE
jgi:prepilin-type N-terminal cleavage/methylation domain-containing protein